MPEHLKAFQKRATEDLEWLPDTPTFFCPICHLCISTLRDFGTRASFTEIFAKHKEFCDNGELFQEFLEYVDLYETLPEDYPNREFIFAEAQKILQEKIRNFRRERLTWVDLTEKGVVA